MNNKQQPNQHQEKDPAKNGGFNLVSTILIVVGIVIMFWDKINGDVLKAGAIGGVVALVIWLAFHFRPSEKEPLTDEKAALVVNQQALIDSQRRYIEDKDEALIKKEKQLRIQEELTDQANEKLKNKEYELQHIKQRLQKLGFNADVLLDSTDLYINDALKLIEIKLNAASFGPELSKDEETAIGCHEHFYPDNRARRINYIWMAAENIAPFLSKNKNRPDGEQKRDISN